MVAALDFVGNPSAVHAEGRKARALVEKARAQVAAGVGCKSDEVVFTSGATEAALILAELQRGGDVVVEETAHDALWAHHWVSQGADGSTGSCGTLAIGLANSETGVISQVPQARDGQWVLNEVAADRLLLDVTQAVGRIPFSFAWSGAQFAILSAHKLGGPKGVGALIVREGNDIEPILRGGGQELGRRSGTENVVGIVGFGAAIEAAVSDLASGRWDEVEKLRNILETSLASEAKETIFVGKGEMRLPNTACFATPGWKGETQVMQMDLAGFAVSSGSACSSGKVKSSRVLQAMGVSDAAAAGALRVSMGPTTTEDEVMRFAEAWLHQHRKFRQRAA